MLYPRRTSSLSMKTASRSKYLSAMYLTVAEVVVVVAVAVAEVAAEEIAPRQLDSIKICIEALNTSFKHIVNSIKSSKSCLSSLLCLAVSSASRIVTESKAIEFVTRSGCITIHIARDMIPETSMLSFWLDNVVVVDDDNDEDEDDKLRLATFRFFNMSSSS